MCVISYMHTMSDNMQTVPDTVVATAPTAAQQVAVRLEAATSRLQMLEADSDEEVCLTAAEEERRLQLFRRATAAGIERNDRRLREREATFGGSYAVIDNVVPEPVVATAPTAAEQNAAFVHQQEVQRHEAGLRAAAENKARRERERASWRDY